MQLVTKVQSLTMRMIGTWMKYQRQTKRMDWIGLSMRVKRRVILTSVSSQLHLIAIMNLAHFAVYAFENYLPPMIRSWIDEKLRGLRVMLVDGGILADNSDDNTESKIVTESRKRKDAAQKELDDNRKSLKSHKEDLEKDFGPDEVFRALKGQCVSTDSGEYTYEICFMEKSTQKPKKGGGHTNLGTYTRMEKITVDDELPANGKGLGSGERIAMKHENGQHCWNGPNRSSTLILACAEENEIWKVMEEEKCVYRIEVGTPAVCEAQNGGGKAASVKDEL